MTDSELPVTRYAVNCEINIAYQTMGEGPIDIILVPGIVSHVEFLHEFPGYTAFLRRLAGIARVITFDKRGQGLSDGISNAPSLEQRMDDVRAVMDDAGSRQAVLLGFSEGSPMSALFAASYPERVSKLVLFGGYAVSDFTQETASQRAKLWGTGLMIKALIPQLASNPDAVRRMAKFERLSASPGAIKAYMSMIGTIDVRSILPAVRVPTLVLHRRNDALIRVRKVEIWPHRYPKQNTSNITTVITPFGREMSRRFSATSRSSSPGIARVHRMSWSASWLRSSSQILWIRRRAPLRWVT